MGAVAEGALSRRLLNENKQERFRLQANDLGQYYKTLSIPANVTVAPPGVLVSALPSK